MVNEGTVGRPQETKIGPRRDHALGHVIEREAEVETDTSDATDIDLHHSPKTTKSQGDAESEEGRRKENVAIDMMMRKLLNMVQVRRLRRGMICHKRRDLVLLPQLNPNAQVTRVVEKRTSIENAREIPTGIGNHHTDVLIVLIVTSVSVRDQRAAIETRIDVDIPKSLLKSNPNPTQWLKNHVSIPNPGKRPLASLQSSKSRVLLDAARIPSMISRSQRGHAILRQHANSKRSAHVTIAPQGMSLLVWAATKTESAVVAITVIGNARRKRRKVDPFQHLQPKILMSLNEKLEIERDC